MNIVLTGSLAFDRIMNFPGYFHEHILPEKVHTLNVSFNIERLEEKCGGTAGNIAMTLALLGEHPRIIAAVGKDFDTYAQRLQKAGIDQTSIERHADIATATAYIITDKADNQITGFVMGALERPTTTHLSKSAEQTLVVISAGNKSDMLRLSQEAKDAGMITLFDPGQTLPFLSAGEILTILEGATFFMVNDYEMQMIMRRTGQSEEALRRRAQTTVITKGSHGATVATEDAQMHIPAIEGVAVVDPTGAGDAFRAGFIKGMVQDCALADAVRMGTVAASFAIATYGTQEHHFTKEEFCTRFEHAYKTGCPLNE